MNIPELSTAEYLSGLANASSGLIGALLGAWVAYKAAKNQYITEYNYKKWDSLRAILIELCFNQSSLFRDLDRSLPIWLTRAHRRGGVDKNELADFVSQTAEYQTTIYQALFSELITTKYGSELALYYRRLTWLKTWKPKDYAAIDRDFDAYALALSMAILSANDLIPAIVEEIRNAPIKAWGKNLDIEEFECSRSQYQFAAELAKFDLEAIEHFIETGTRPPAFSEFLANSNPEKFKSYLAASKKYAGWPSHR